MTKTDEPTATPEATPEASPRSIDVRSAALELAKLMATLVPPETIEISDEKGNKYKAPSALGARKQTAIIRMATDLWDNNISHDVEERMKRIRDAKGDRMTAIREFVLGAITHEEAVVKMVATTFEVAHPEIVEAARHRRLAWLNRDRSGEGIIDAGGTKASTFSDVLSLDAADLFPIEELVGGLFPIYARIAAKITTTIEMIPG